MQKESAKNLDLIKYKEIQKDKTVRKIKFKQTPKTPIFIKKL